MYATPVIYPLSTITNPTLRHVMELNPMTALLETFKYGAFSTGTLAWTTLAYSTLAATILTLLGMLLFKHKEKTFIDTI